MKDILKALNDNTTLVIIFGYFAGYIFSVVKQWGIFVYDYLWDIIERRFIITINVDSETVIRYFKYALSERDSNRYKIVFDGTNYSNGKFSFDVDYDIDYHRIYNLNGIYFWFTKRESDRVVTIKIFNRGVNNEMINNMIQYCKGKYDKKYISVFDWIDNTWVKVSNVAVRDRETVFGDATNAVISDIEGFLKTNDFYSLYNIPYKKTYLLHGPPGTGKTTCVKLAGSMFNRNIYRLSLTQDLNDRSLELAFRTTDDASIILFDDFDPMAVIKDSPGTEILNKIKNGLTVPGILNILDGIASQTGNIIMMTTNNIDQIREIFGPAFFRAGRIDKSVHFDYATPSDIRSYYKYFYGRAKSIYPETEQHISKLATRFNIKVNGKDEDQGLMLDKIAQEFVKLTDNRQISFSALQAYLLSYRSDMDQGFKHIKELGDS